MEQRLEKISNLQDKIGVDLKEADDTDFTKKDEKEQKKYYHNYKNYQTLSKNSLEKMKKIDNEIENITSKIKSLVVPDTDQWEKWTGRDLKKCVDVETVSF